MLLDAAQCFDWGKNKCKPNCFVVEVIVWGSRFFRHRDNEALTPSVEKDDPPKTRKSLLRLFSGPLYIARSYQLKVYSH